MISTVLAKYFSQPAFGLALTLFFAALLLGPRFSIYCLSALLLLLITFAYPEFVILAQLFIVSGMLESVVNPMIRVASRSFYLSDFLLLSLLAVLAFRVLLQPDFRLSANPIGKPMLLFLLAVVISIPTATISHRMKFSDLTPELRIFFYYALFYCTKDLVRSKTQLLRLIMGIYLLGVLLAGAMIAQVFFGFSAFFGRSAIMAEGQAGRLYNFSFVIVYIVCISIAVHIFFREHRRYYPILMPSFLVLSLAFVVTLGQKRHGIRRDRLCLHGCRSPSSRASNPEICGPPPLRGVVCYGSSYLDRTR